MNKGALKSLALLGILSLILASLAFPQRASATYTAEYSLATGARPVGVYSAKSNVYFAEQYINGSSRIGILNPVTSEITEIKLRDQTGPYGIWVDFDENFIWFTEYRDSKVGRLKKIGTDWELLEFQLPAGSAPAKIVADDENNAYFTQQYGNKIGWLKFDGSQWVLREYSLPTPNSAPLGIAKYRDYIWFTEYMNDRIGRLNLGTGIIEEYDASAGRPYDITVDEDGYVWFTAESNYIGGLAPWSNIMTFYAIPTGNCKPRGIAYDPNAREIWFAEFDAAQIGRFVPARNVFYEYPTPTRSSQPWYLAVRSTSERERDVYFGEFAIGKLGRLSQGPGRGPTVTTTVPALSTASTSETTTSFITSSPQSNTTKIYLKADTNITYGSFASTASTTSSTITDTVSISMTTTTGVMPTTTTVWVVTPAPITTTYTTYVATVQLTASTTSTSISTSYVATTSMTLTYTYLATSYAATSTTTMLFTRTTRAMQTIAADTFTSTSTEWVMETRTESLTATTTQTQFIATATSTATAIATATTTLAPGPPRPQLPTGPPRCLIATAAYGSELDPRIQFLRGFRDGVVMGTFAGGRFMEAFNAWYYSFSPAVAEALYGDEGLRAIARAALAPLIASLEASSAAHSLAAPLGPEAAVAIAGLIASSLIGAAYLGPPLAIAALKWPGRRAWGRAALSAAIALSASAALMALAEASASGPLMAASASAFVASAIAASGLGIALAAMRIAQMARGARPAARAKRGDLGPLSPGR
jgi:streptogramin lyase